MAPSQLQFVGYFIRVTMGDYGWSMNCITPKDYLGNELTTIYFMSSDH